MQMPWNAKMRKTTTTTTQTKCNTIFVCATHVGESERVTGYRGIDLKLSFSNHK